MSLTYSQKTYIQKAYPEKTTKEIAERLHVPIKDVEAHLHKNKQLIEKKLVKEIESKETKLFSKQWFIEHLPYLILLFLFILVVYFNSFTAELVSDDIYAIKELENQLKNVNYIWHNPTFILRSLLYYISYQIGGLSPFAYRIWNILFHVGVVWLVYAIVPFFTKKKYVPFFAASLMAVHPMTIEAVTWISGGIYVQAAFFLLISFLSYLLYQRTEDKKFFVSTVIFYIFALSISEKVIVYPFIIGWYELTLGSLKESWQRITLFFGISFLWGLMILTRVSERFAYLSSKTGNDASSTFYNPLLQIPTAIATYLHLYVWPDSLTLYHSDFDLSAPAKIIYILVTLLLFGFGIYLFKRNKVLAFWLGFFLITLLTTMNPFGLSWLVAERYAYLGSVGVFFIWGYAISSLTEHKKLQTLGYLLFAILLVAFSARTIARNNDWRTQDNLWFATAKTSPSDPKTHNNVGDVYARRGDLDKAAEAFTQAIKVNPRYPDAYHNLANIYWRAGKTNEAMDLYVQAYEMNPTLWQSAQNIAALLINEKKFAEAEPYIKAAIKLNPQNPELYTSYATVKAGLGDLPGAREQVMLALTYDPQNETARQMLMQLDTMK
ncbi:MAG: tetratricopeptide repeat protein [Weeksellaceae bacterium]